MTPAEKKRTGDSADMSLFGRLSRRRFVSLSLAAVGTFVAACRSTVVSTPTPESASVVSDSPTPLATKTPPSTSSPTPIPPPPTASLTATSAPPSPSPSLSPTPDPTATAQAPTQQPTVAPTTPPTATSVPATSTSPPQPTATPGPVQSRSDLMAHWPAVDKSRVVLVRHGGVWSDGVPEPARVRQMLGEGMKALARTADVQAVWQVLFDPGERVLLKVNCIAYGGPTQPAVTYAVAERLQEAGLRAENILIFDRTDHELQSAGYVLNEGGSGVQCHGARGEGSEAPLTQARVRFFQEVDNCDAIVNLPTPKQHGGAGISVAMKNHYGSVNQPGRLHGDWCDPAIAELNAQDNIRHKTRLIVGAALKVSPVDWNQPKREDALLLSFDPVALDTVARDILVRHRQALGLDTGFLVNGARQLATAQTLGLGTTDAGHIDLQEVLLG